MANIFQPVRGEQKTINSLPIREGYVYFAYDTGNIYLDRDGFRHLMGGSSTGIVYAVGNDATIIKNDPENDGDRYFTIYANALENSDTLPLKDSLILNSDGRFFRVIESDYSTSTVQAILLAVSGSGGSGSGGGFVQDLSLTWDENTIAQGHAFIYGVNSKAIFKPSATTGDTRVSLTFVIDYTDKEGEQKQIIKTAPSVLNNSNYEFDTSIFPLASNMTMKITISASNSQMTNQSRTYTITYLSAVEMRLQKVSDEYLPLVSPDNTSRNLTVYYMPIGDNSLTNVLIHTYVDGEEVSVSAIQSSWYNRSVPHIVSNQSYGAHTIALRMSAVVNGATVYTEPIYFEAAWADASDDSPIIWLGKCDTTVINYENAYISYMVYDPQAIQKGLPATITLYQNGHIIGEITADYSTSDWITWDISAAYEVGNNTFSIVCRNSRKDVEVFVTEEGSRDLGLINPNSLLVNFSAAGRSNLEIASNRTKWEDPKGIKAVLTDFNWQNNGWNTDGVQEDGIDNGAYLSIANGAKVSIPIGGSQGLSLNNDSDYSVELRFRVRNIQKYSSLVHIVPKYFYNDENGHPTYIITYDDESGQVAYISGESLYESEIIANGYSIAVDRTGNLLMDENNSNKEIEFDSEGNVKDSVVKWLNAQNFGLCLGTQEAFFSSPSGIANVRYCEDEVINLSFIISKTNQLVYIYLNGILSGAAALPTGTGSFFSINSPIEFNSTYCDFDLYRFRVYQLGLTMPDVIHNYLSDIHSLALYDQNQITDPLDATSLSYELLVDYNKNNPDSPTMPYAVWQITTDNRDEKLPYKKGDNCYCNIDFVNPPLDRALEQGEIDEWFYYTHSPSFSAQNVDINVQGTSSQKYPRRNYKTKYKKAKNWIYTKGSLAGQLLTDKHTVLQTKDERGKDLTTPIEHTLEKKFHMDTESFGTNKFTWKIDYMESSGSYNTGFANLIGNLSHPLYTKHPLDDLNLGLDTSDMRTSVYGFPVLTFHKYSDGTYEYIGRYNMNLDKSSNEYYGFEDKTEQPYVEKRIRKVLDADTNSLVSEEYQPTIGEIAECWELKDNQGSWCSFKYPNNEARENGFGTLQEGTEGDNAKLEILNHFEYRASFYGDELDAAYEYASFTDTNTQVKYENNGQINQYLREKHANLEILFNWLDSTNPATATNAVLPDGGIDYNVASIVSDDDSITYTLISEGSWSAHFTKDTKEYRRQKFRAEFEKHLDLEYCLTYYVLTELLLCYDSRGKNVMMASFGPHTKGGDYIWYPIFYDIDTQLGLNNSGAYLWDYDADVTKNNLFSTPTSVLWNNLYDLFYNNIVQKYRVLRGVSSVSSSEASINGSLTYENIAGAYNFNAKVFNSYAMKGVRPTIAIGLDEYYKYLAPALSAEDFNRGKKYAGYYDTSGAHVYQKTPTYVYACQGDKKLTTELLLRNRLNYIDSWWLGGDYRAGVVENQIFIRANANHNETSDLFLDSASLSEIPQKAIDTNKPYTLYEYPNIYYDARPGAKIKPFLHQYVSYFMDSQPSIPVKYDESAGQEDGVWTNVDSGKLAAFKTEVDLSQQITYIPGGDYISSLGDISLMYPNSLQIFHGRRLLDLNIGSDMPEYKNPLLNSSSDWELDDMPLLKSVNIGKLSAFSMELDLTKSTKLQEFRALGSIIQRINFAPGAPLHTVHLPKSMTTISLVQHKELNQLIRTTPVVVSSDYVRADPGSYRGLFIEGVTNHVVKNYTTDENNRAPGHAIATYEIVGGGLGYGSYEILYNLYNLKATATKNQNLAISLKEVQWTPYETIAYGESYDSSITYYKLTEHSTFEDYTYDSTSWDNDTLNGLIFTRDNDVDTSIIKDTSLLDALIEQYEIALSAGTYTQFSNTQGLTSATIPTITGSMFIANGDGDAILEEEFTSKYAKYFPNLTIQAEKVQEANVTKYVRVLETGVIETIESLRSSESHPLAPTAQVPLKAGYDFIGWSTDAEGQNMFLNYTLDINTGNGSYDNLSAELNSYTFSGDNNILVLYAQYRVHINKVIIYQGNIRIGAALISNGTAFSIPDKIYYYDENNNIDDSIAYNYRPYKDDSTLALENTYKFIGFSQVATDESDGGTITTKAPDIVTRDLTLYEIYKEDSVYNTDYTDLFEIADSSVNYEDERSSSFNGVGIGLRFKPKTKKSIKGKVVIPAKFNGSEVISFWKSEDSEGGLGEALQSEITHIFLEPLEGKDYHPLRVINAEAFCHYFQESGTTVSVPSVLHYFDFDHAKKLRVVNRRAFYQVDGLELNDSIGENLYRAEESSFSRAFGPRASGDNIIYIPSSLTYVGSKFFAYQTVSNCSLMIGAAENPSLLDIDVTTTNTNLIYFGQSRERGSVYENIYWYVSDYKYIDVSNTASLRFNLGFERDSGSCRPKNFTIFCNGTEYPIIVDQVVQY